MLKVIASQGPNRFLVMDCDDVAEALSNPRARGRILDLKQGVFFREQNAHSVIEKNSWAGAQWQAATMSDEELQRHLSQVEDVEATK